jgi:hypothetical protein
MSSSGNCTPIEDVELVTLSCSAYVPPFQEDTAEDLFTPENLCNINNNYSTTQLQPLVENTLVYMSGFIVRKLLKKLTCTNCRELLVSTEQSKIYKESFILLETKQCGGLITPSDFCITTILLAEKHLRNMGNIHNIMHCISQLKLQRNVIKEICNTNKLFNAERHMIETQSGIENHIYSVIREMVSVFLKIRHHHIVKSHNIKEKGLSVRHNLTKTILFKNH